ncbi:iron-sulfur cluster carrier protein-like [Ylistrum balloti]|uniref:iron-sulfur cluster carrier protein-like n=1 Tax=Ylistrum balloti TaxID=509963 RepID=UPI0029057DA3|nr:iron-sulfur cluster carrier protein-like [Ylistrum balloti]
MNRDDVVNLLRTIKYPNLDRDIIDYGVVQGVDLEGEKVSIVLDILARNDEIPNAVRTAVETTLKEHGLEPDIRMQVKRFPNVSPNAKSQTPQQPLGPHGTSPDPWADRQRLENVKYVLAVASGKGGVGKSTVAVNLAYALKFRGLNVGLLDADIYGPSQPIMLGVKDIEVVADEQQRIYPIEVQGLKTISIGYLIEDEQPVVWRGPLVMKTIEQFLRGVAWGALDILVVDLPPGTGDAQLSLVQKTPIDGVIIVTTPQDVALADVIRGHSMFEKMDVPTLGIIENMSYFVAPDTGKRYELFDHGGGRKAATDRNLPFLGELPLDPKIRSGADQGKPIVIADPASENTQVFHEIAEKVVKLLEESVRLH